jgi:hypothetical protein
MVIPMRNTILSLLFLAFLGVPLLAQDCAPGWAHYRTLTVDNSAGVELSDYQIEFILNTEALVGENKLQADGADLRVYSSNCTPLPFWGDSLGTSAATRIFVKVPSIAAGGSVDLQVYYGNASAAPATDGEGTFVFFDDFEGDEVDADKWEAVGEFATFQTNNGLLQYSSTSMNPGPRFKFARTKASFSEKAIFDFVIQRSNTNGFGFSSADSLLERFLIRDSGFGFDTLNQIAVIRDTTDNGQASQNSYPILRFDRRAFNTVSITPHINDQNEFVMTRFANEGLGDENLDTLTVQGLNMSGFHFIVSSFGAPFVIEMDNIRVRQHTDNPPVSVVGMEMGADPNSLPSMINPELVEVYPNPASNQLVIAVDWETDVQVRLLDASGRLVTGVGALLLDATPRTMDLTQVPVGVYVLQFVGANDGQLLHGRQLMIAR